MSPPFIGFLGRFADHRMMAKAVGRCNAGRYNGVIQHPWRDPIIDAHYQVHSPAIEGNSWQRIPVSQAS